MYGYIYKNSYLHIIHYTIIVNTWCADVMAINRPRHITSYLINAGLYFYWTSENTIESFLIPNENTSCTFPCRRIMYPEPRPSSCSTQIPDPRPAVGQTLYLGRRLLEHDVSGGSADIGDSDAGPVHLPDPHLSELHPGRLHPDTRRCHADGWWLKNGWRRSPVELIDLSTCNEL